MHLAVAIREGAPVLTIIVEGAGLADDDDLVFMEPLRDPNVIYNFHFYEPHLGCDVGRELLALLEGGAVPVDDRKCADGGSAGAGTGA